MAADKSDLVEDSRNSEALCQQVISLLNDGSVLKAGQLVHLNDFMTQIKRMTTTMKQDVGLDLIC